MAAEKQPAAGPEAPSLTKGKWRPSTMDQAQLDRLAEAG